MPGKVRYGFQLPTSKILETSPDGSPIDPGLAASGIRHPVGMARRDLLRQIERGAHDTSSDLASLVRRCISLGGVTGSESLREWATRELMG